MSKVIVFVGGQKSGKSVAAERLALNLSHNPVYMATAHVEDEEFRERVRIHKERRGPEWTTIEEEKWLSHYDVSGRVVLVDCSTLWLANFLTFETPEITRRQLEEVEEEFDRLIAQDATFIFVANEVGLGGISANDMQRQFADCLGAFNQYIAGKADEVYMVVAGISVKIKG